MAFILVQENEYDPFEVEFVAQNEEAGTELIARFKIKHVADWPESELDEHSRLRSKYNRVISLSQKNAKEMNLEESGEYLRSVRALSANVAKSGINDEDREVWNTLTLPQQTIIVIEWLKWNDLQAKEEKE